MDQSGHGRICPSSASWYLLALLAYAASVPMLGPSFMLPYGRGFALALLWATSRLGGSLMARAGLPDLLGNLASGVLLKNAMPPGPQGYDGASLSVRGLPNAWASAVTRFGLMLILLRAGLQMDTRAVARGGGVVLRLAVIPGLCEALVVSGAAAWAFGMPFFLALALGFILAAVSPAVVVSSMSDLQAQGYGVSKGIPSLVVAAAMFDGVVAISGFSLVLGLALDSGAPLWLQVGQGPATLAAGLAFGAAAGWVCGGTDRAAFACLDWWDSAPKRTAAVFWAGALAIYTAAYLQEHWVVRGGGRPIGSGAGAVATLTLAVVAQTRWRARGLSDANAAGFAGHHITMVWAQVGQPLLFSVVGSTVNLRWIEAASVPRAVGVIGAGLAVRLCAALAVTGSVGGTCGNSSSSSSSSGGRGALWTLKERGVVAAAWGSKATIQAALCTIPLVLVAETMTPEAEPAKHRRYTRHAEEILTTAVLSIVLTAPASLLAVQWLGPKWLSRDDGTGGASAKEGGQQQEKEAEEAEGNENSQLKGGVKSPISEEARRAGSGSGRFEFCGGSSSGAFASDSPKAAV